MPMAAPKAHFHKKRDAAVTTLSTLEDVVTDDVNVTVYIDDDGETTTDLPATTPTTTVSPVATAVQDDVVAGTSAANTAANTAAVATSAQASATSTSTTSSSSYSSSSSSIDGDLKSFASPGKFVDGTLSCDSVPVGNGVISIDWLQYNGWASILNLGGYASTTCVEGYYCSYACQAGMAKTQWPSDQPSSGVSIGGLVCKNGYLYRTNTDTDYLCEWGK